MRRFRPARLVIQADTDIGPYRWFLRAGNGLVLLESDAFASEQECRAHVYAVTDAIQHLTYHVGGIPEILLLTAAGKRALGNNETVV
jgi:uncharacterized protein YegP (UPF0339 family)